MLIWRNIRPNGKVKFTISQINQISNVFQDKEHFPFIKAWDLPISLNVLKKELSYLILYGKGVIKLNGSRLSVVPAFLEALMHYNADTTGPLRGVVFAPETRWLFLTCEPLTWFGLLYHLALHSSCFVFALHDVLGTHWRLAQLCCLLTGQGTLCMVILLSTVLYG